MTRLSGWRRGLVLIGVLLLAAHSAAAQAIPAPHRDAALIGSGEVTALERVPGSQEIWALRTTNADPERYTFARYRPDSGWTTHQLPATDRTIVLWDFAFAAPDEGWAVGYTHSGNFGDRKPYLLRWDGESWSVQPAPPGSAAWSLDGVSASTPDNAWITATSQDADTNWIYRAWRWDGSAWEPAFGPTRELALADVVATGTQQAWMSVVDHSGGDATFQHWTGTAWSRMSVANLSYVLDLAATTPDNIWATNDFAGEPQAAHWDGETWTGVETLPYDYAVDIDTTADGEAWIIGTQYGDDADDLVARTVDGDWTAVSTPHLCDSSRHALLRSVTALAPDDVYVAGGCRPSVGQDSNTLVMHYDGETWQRL